MSKQNKVNKSNYVQGGRLTPDDLARERMKQGEQSRAKGKTNVIGKTRASAAQEPNRPQTEREEEE
jgi:hypothetical protein